MTGDEQLDSIYPFYLFYFVLLYSNLMDLEKLKEYGNVPISKVWHGDMDI